MDITLELRSKQDTQKLAEVFAEKLQKGDVVLLSGNLGAGKTTFAQFLIQYLCGPGTIVTSPTFPILNIYETRELQIYHYDFYRIKNKNEIEELGLSEGLKNAIVLIEWPQIMQDEMPQNKINLCLTQRNGTVSVAVNLCGRFLNENNLQNSLLVLSKSML